MEHILELVPDSAKPQLIELLASNPVRIKITKKRLTKHGDFRKLVSGISIITINYTTNPYRFLITLLHELAHFKVFQRCDHYLKPHGEEWRTEYKSILFPFLNPCIFPDPLLSTLANHMKRPKASTDSDFKLVMSLREYDPETFYTPVFKLEKGQQFKLSNGKEFIKLKKRRTRIECKEIISGKIYLFSAHAEVIPSSSLAF